MARQSPYGFPEWTNPSENWSGRELDRLDRLARRTEKITFEGADGSVGDGGVAFGRPEPDGIEALIGIHLGVSNVAIYAFVQARFDDETEEWVEAEGGLSSGELTSEDCFAVERNGNFNVQPGTRERLVRVSRRFWAFSHCCTDTAPPVSPSGSGSGPDNTDGCTKCSGTTPALVTITVAGLTGDCAVFNGTWTTEITADPCRWTFATDTVSVFVYRDGTSWRARLGTLDGVYELEYTGGTGTNCCTTTVLTYAADLTGNSCANHPNITLTSHCGEVPCDDPCDHLDAGIAPEEWALPGTGFTNDGGCLWGTTFGSGQTLARSGAGCVWRSPGSLATLEFRSGHWIVDLFENVGNCNVSYTASFTDGCSPQVLTRTTVVAGTPATITLTPSGGCCPDTGGGGGGGGTVSVPCCPDAWASLLYAHFSNGAGDCVCLNGTVVPLPFGTVNWSAHFTSPCAGGDYLMTFAPCTTGALSSSILALGTAFGAYNGGLSSCGPPLTVVFDVTVAAGVSVCNAGGGTVRVTILDTP